MSVEAEIFRGRGQGEVDRMKSEITRQRTILCQDAVNMGLVPFHDGFLWADPAYKMDWFKQGDKEFATYREQVVDGRLELVRYETHTTTEENRTDEVSNRLSQVLLINDGFTLPYWDKFDGLQLQKISGKVRKSRRGYK